MSVVTESLAESFVIEGGNRLNGRIRAAGNKNGALPILAACVLSREPITLANVPRIRDVGTMLELLAEIGADVDWVGPHEVRVDAAEVSKTELDEELCARMRASFLLAGPLLARFRRVTVPPPGGDVIGRRRLDPHMHAFEQLGATVHATNRYEMSAERLRGVHVFLDEASVMATENAVMAAVLAEGETVIGNAACEPHVQDLCRFLVSLGAAIDGIGSNVLRVQGVRELRGGEHRIGPDHIEVGELHRPRRGDRRRGSWSTTSSPPTSWPSRPRSSASACASTSRAAACACPTGSSSRSRTTSATRSPKIDDGPWPQFPADLTSIAVAVATQAHGTLLIFEKMFESRLFFVDKLVSMGARIILCDPHRVVVTGPARLYGQHMASPDIRAGMAMLIAALCAEGTSTIGEAYQIDKGYERIDERLRALGARIERVDG